MKGLVNMRCIANPSYLIVSLFSAKTVDICTPLLYNDIFLQVLLCLYFALPVVLSLYVSVS